MSLIQIELIERQKITSGNSNMLDPVFVYPIPGHLCGPSFPITTVKYGSLEHPNVLSIWQAHLFIFFLHFSFEYFLCLIPLII